MCFFGAKVYMNLLIQHKSIALPSNIPNLWLLTVFLLMFERVGGKQFG